jgi:hypothetical protein
MDTCSTIIEVVNYLEKQGAKNVLVSFLTAKHKEEKREPKVYTFLKNHNKLLPNCFYIPDYWVVGHGLDWNIAKPTDKDLENLRLSKDDVDWDYFNENSIHIGRSLPEIVVIHPNIRDELRRCAYRDPESVVNILSGAGVYTSL